MNKHTFQVGDRVVSVGHVNSRARGDEYGKVAEVMAHGVGVEFDRKEVNRPDGRWFLSNDKVQHDTNFQVGDWVRYEGVVPEHRYGEINEQYVDNPLTVERIRGDGSIEILAHDKSYRMYRVCERENLVKIQPPQEVQVVIQEKESNNRRVHGVQECMIDGVKGWRKDDENRMIFYPSTYWEPLTEWVTIQVKKEGFDKLKLYGHLYGYSDEALMDNEYTKWRYPQSMD